MEPSQLSSDPLVTAKDLHHPVLPPDSSLLREGEEGACSGALSKAHEQENRVSVPSAEWLIVTPRIPKLTLQGVRGLEGTRERSGSI